MTTATFQWNGPARGPFQAVALVLVFWIGLTLGLLMQSNPSRAEVPTPPVSAQPRPLAAPAPAATGRIDP